MVCMCPDRQIVSLYLDGELPSPWREKMEAHLDSCQQCSCALAKYRTLGNIFPQPQAQVIEDAQGRVWKEIAALDQFSVRRSVVQPEAKH
ncbi:MAG: zf-HC2 domain-containing protein, partial [Treponema sp.]|nr:zf-HC2 domain-containing protein [Treponema sp.]